MAYLTSPNNTQIYPCLAGLSTQEVTSLESYGQAYDGMMVWNTSTNQVLIGNSPSNNTFMVVGGGGGGSVGDWVFGSGTATNSTANESQIFTPNGTGNFLVNNGGVGFPQLTTTQMNAIVAPRNGMLIWNTTAGAFYQYNSGWAALVSTPASLGNFTFSNSGVMSVPSGNITIEAGAGSSVQLSNPLAIGSLNILQSSPQLQSSTGVITFSNTSSGGIILAPQTTNSGNSLGTTALNWGTVYASFGVMNTVSSPAATDLTLAPPSGQKTTVSGPLNVAITGVGSLYCGGTGINMTPVSGDIGINNELTNSSTRINTLGTGSVYANNVEIPNNITGLQTSVASIQSNLTTVNSDISLLNTSVSGLQTTIAGYASSFNSNIIQINASPLSANSYRLIVDGSGALNIERYDGVSTWVSTQKFT